MHTEIYIGSIVCVPLRLIFIPLHSTHPLTMKNVYSQVQFRVKTFFVEAHSSEQRKQIFSRRYAFAALVSSVTCS